MCSCFAAQLMPTLVFFCADWARLLLEAQHGGHTGRTFLVRSIVLYVIVIGVGCCCHRLCRLGVARTCACGPCLRDCGPHPPPPTCTHHDRRLPACTCCPSSAFAVVVASAAAVAVRPSAAAVLIAVAAGVAVSYNRRARWVLGKRTHARTHDEVRAHERTHAYMHTGGPPQQAQSRRPALSMPVYVHLRTCNTSAMNPEPCMVFQDSKLLLHRIQQHHSSKCAVAMTVQVRCHTQPPPHSRSPTQRSVATWTQRTSVLPCMPGPPGPAAKFWSGGLLG